MLSELIQRVQELLTPYTLEQFMQDADPKDHKDIKRLEAVWHSYQNKKFFNSCY
jgi:hypothetical protein